MTATISDGRSERDKRFVVNLENDKPTDSKFQIGDKAILNRDVAFTQGFGVCLINAGQKLKITNYSNLCGGDLYEIKFQNAMSVVYGCDLNPIVSEQETSEVKRVEWEDGVLTLVNDKPIESRRLEYRPVTEHIKTFEDAYEWCKENDRYDLIEQYQDALNVGLQRAKDILAYLKLRTQRGLGAETVSKRYALLRRNERPMHRYCTCCGGYGHRRINTAHTLFQDKGTALYAASQFNDIYIGLCKGKE